MMLHIRYCEKAASNGSNPNGSILLFRIQILDYFSWCWIDEEQNFVEAENGYKNINRKFGTEH